jgi:2-methylaconitate cis-trans-isomerase PrpF
MPAEDWIYEITDAQLADIEALDRCSAANTSLAASGRPLGLAVSSRSAYESVNGGIRNSVNAAATLGLLTDENDEQMQRIYKMLIAAEAAYAAYSIVHGLVLAKTALETAMAAAETTMHALVLDFGSIALATAAAASVYAVTQFASGEWRLPSVDIGTPSGRHQAAVSLERVSTGG